MPVQQVRKSIIRPAVRQAVALAAAEMVADMPHVSIHSVVASDIDDGFSPFETNALRIVIDGISASLHRTAIPVLVKLDSGRNVADAVNSARSQLETVIRSQVTRHVQLHRKGIPVPYAHDPFGYIPDSVVVDHLQGQRLEMLRMLHEGGRAHVRRVYGGIAAMILRRRINGFPGAYEDGAMAGTEISSNLRIGDHSVLHKNKLYIDRHLPETLVTALSGSRLGAYFEIGGLEEIVIWSAETRNGSPIERGIKSRPHTRLHLMGNYKCDVGSFVDGPR